MFKTDFAIFYAVNFESAIICLVISYLLFGLLVYRQIYSVFDPAFFFFILSASGYSVVMLLWHKEKISDYYFFCFMISQVLFYLGWNIFSPRWKKQINRKIRIDSFSIVLYYISSTLFILLQSYVYKIMGFPIFMDSRLDAFSSGGGIGILDRIIFVSSIFSFSFAAFRLVYLKGWRFFDVIILIFFMFTKIVSGSKLSVLEAVFLIGLILMFHSRSVMNKSIEVRVQGKLYFFVLLSIPIALVVTYIQQSSMSEQPLGVGILIGKLLLRFVNTGDIFYLAWVDDYLRYIPDRAGFFALFSDSLGAARLVPRSDLPQHLGFSVMLAHTSTENTIGPNARFNVFGLHYFGVLGLFIYSLILGVLVGYLRNRVRYRLPFTTSSLMLYTLLAYIALYIEQDFSSMALKYFLNLAIFSFLLFPFVYLVSRYRKDTYV
ncbi:hypothetical protein [Agarivorans sp. QJM3NY_33]|uniref:hypothetical protein n=1 Tax=Agarivorans sp. QJM3NY_33 TaxID=3421432 RepID=UPI003D7E0158